MFPLRSTPRHSTPLSRRSSSNKILASFCFASLTHLTNIRLRDLSPLSMSASKLKLFDRVDLDFKAVHGHALKTSILVPKRLQSKPKDTYPTIVNWHGGGFVVGDRLYEGWLPVWLLDMCLTDSAIFIAPDYRLLPEATGADVLDDVKDFWCWLHHTLPTLMTNWNALPDLNRLACTGQSAGGYLAVQSALLFLELSHIKVVASMGGSLDTDIPHCRIPGPRLVLGRKPPPPGKAEKIVRTYVKDIKPQTVRTSGNVVDMWDFLTCVLQQAYLARWFGAMGKEELDAMKMLERAEEMPPIWLIHGKQDSVVPPLCSIGFVEKLKETHPDVPVRLNLQAGDHGFEARLDGKEEWIQEGVEFIKEYWP